MMPLNVFPARSTRARPNLKRVYHKRFLNYKVSFSLFFRCFNSERWDRRGNIAEPGKGAEGSPPRVAFAVALPVWIGGSRPSVEGDLHRG